VTAALALREDPGPRRGGGRVPVEWIGQARLLRSGVAASSTVIDAATEALIAPFRPRPGFTPMPQRRMLDRLARRWRALPNANRIRFSSKFEERKLVLLDVRVEPGRISLPGWSEGELALSLILRTTMLKPPAFFEVALPLAHVGLHAIARRFQRGIDRAAVAVLRDLAPLAQAWPATIDGGQEFEIPTGTGGRWIGAVMQAAEVPVLLVRTFI
jgi:hypothetical protein